MAGGDGVVMGVGLGVMVMMVGDGRFIVAWW